MLLSTYANLPHKLIIRLLFFKFLLNRKGTDLVFIKSKLLKFFIMPTCFAKQVHSSLPTQFSVRINKNYAFLLFSYFLWAKQLTNIVKVVMHIYSLHRFILFYTKDEKKFSKFMLTFAMPESLIRFERLSASFFSNRGLSSLRKSLKNLKRFKVSAYCFLDFSFKSDFIRFLPRLNITTFGLRSALPTRYRYSYSLFVPDLSSTFFYFYVFFFFKLSSIALKKHLFKSWSKLLLS